MNFSNYPVLKLLVPFILGIICARYCYFSMLTCQILGFVSFGILLFSIIFCRFLSHDRQWVAGLLMQISFVIFGYILATARMEPFQWQKKQALALENTCWVGHLQETPVAKGEKAKCKVEILQTADNKPFFINVILYFPASILNDSLKMGDVLLLNTRLRPFAPPKNPDSFDYGEMMRRRGIFYSGYVLANDYTYLCHARCGFIKPYAKKIQQTCVRLFSTAGLQGPEHDIIAAMLLGDVDEMDPELRTTYADAGVSHILAVSGMHVGIIFMVMNTLLKPMEYNRRTRILKTILLILTVWGYATITGLSPSVTRAATMFAFVSFGNLLKRHTCIFHSLYASLFIILIINTNLLFETGFQLSYLAVFGIVMFQPLLLRIWNPKNKIFSYLWGIITVSIAAQLSTGALSLCCFGQFPNYFLLSNVSVILLSVIVMITGIIVLLCSFSGWLVIRAGILLSCEIKFMNSLILFIEQMPGAVSRNISLLPLQAFLIYLFLLSFYLCIIFKNKKLLFFGLFVLLFFSGSCAWRRVHSRHEHSVVAYTLGKATGIHFDHHGQALLLEQNIPDIHTASYRLSISPHEQARGMKTCWLNLSRDTVSPVHRFYKKQQFILFDTCTFYLLSGKQFFYPSFPRLLIHYLYLHDYPRAYPEKTAQAIDFKNVIISETVTTQNRQRWIDYCEKEHIPCHIMAENGAWVLEK
ncbi:MAG: ComEC family competence protein [Bacteroidales bacterium]|jgi:competence protein ComEC|nr:ComEC family competence protein [Bacteroidales bacterium]